MTFLNDAFQRHSKLKQDYNNIGLLCISKILPMSQWQSHPSSTGICSLHVNSHRLRGTFTRNLHFSCQGIWKITITTISRAFWKGEQITEILWRFFSRYNPFKSLPSLPKGNTGLFHCTYMLFRTKLGDFGLGFHSFRHELVRKLMKPATLLPFPCTALSMCRNGKRSLISPPYTSNNNLSKYRNRPL